MESSYNESARAIAGSIAGLFAPETALDIGCGTGMLMKALEDHGVRTVGLEYASAALDLCRRKGLDVRRFDLESGGPISLDEQFDLVISTEVAEHLPPQYADPLVDLLCGRGRLILFTAATPGQGGADHVNEQPHEYWIARFERRGYVFDEVTSLRLRSDWAQRKVANFYVKNLMIFRRP